MAATRMVKCKYCGIQFNRNAEPFVEVGGRRYAHKECAEKYQQSISQEERDYMELEKYIKKLFKKNVVSARIKKQIKDFKQEYKYTYSGMQKTLYWWFELKHNSIEKANDGIGIVPFVYNDALNYFYNLYLADIANKAAPERIKKPEVQEIEIGSPRVYVAPPKLFDFGEESVGEKNE